MNECSIFTKDKYPRGITRKADGKPTRTYEIWRGMIRRCRDKKRQEFAEYGGRGIVVCERWKEYKNFLTDMGEVPQGLSLDRIDPNGNYEPSNCRWADASLQAFNCRVQSNNKSGHTGVQ